MPIFHLVRHASHGLLGHTLCGRLDGISLNDQGNEEAAALAEGFAGEPIAAVYASPLDRAIETATPIARRLGLELAIEPRLNEIDFGAWTGRSFDELHQAPGWRVWNEFRSGSRAPGGETIVEVQARVVALMLDLRERHPEGEIVMVSHGDVIKGALAYWTGVPVELFRRVDVEPASVSSIGLDAGDVRILCVNRRPRHL